MDVAISYVLAAIATVFTLLQAYRRPKQPGMYVFSLILSILYGAVVMFSSGIALLAALPLASLAVIAVNMLYSYSNHRYDFLSAVAVAIISMAYLFFQSANMVPFIEAFAVGSLVALVLKFGYYQKSNREDKRLEKRRDAFQLAIGTISILAFVLAKPYAYILVFLFVMIGYTMAGSMLSHKVVTGFLKSMERSGAVFGAGAIYMAVGTLLILGSITDYNYLLLGLVALLICDAVATIVGVHGKNKLPYNRNKTIEGTLAYFVILAVFGYFLASYYGILLAMVLALLESALETIDDNIAIPIATIIFYYLVAI